jgi:gliding motility-associated-like protein
VQRYKLGGGAVIKSLRIYDRWGTLLFERRNVQVNDRNSGWDGKVDGIMMPSGAYVYMAQLTCIDGADFEYKGTVTLIR